MIATVKIAPLEHWCPEGQERFRQIEGAKLEGSIEIQTRSMFVSTAYHNGRSTRFWRVSKKFRNYTGELVCEHMLEMD